MMDATAIRNFLLRRPRAVTLRLSDDNGMVSEIAPQGELARVAESIEAMRPALVEALDKQGRLVRAMRDDGEPRQRERSSDSAPELPESLQADPTAVMLSHFANLLHRAYEHSTSVAFARMIELVQLQNERTQSIEARLERAEGNYRREQQDRIAETLERAEEAASKGEMDPMITSLLGGLLQGQMTRGGPPNGHGTNGAKQ